MNYFFIRSLQKLIGVSSTIQETIFSSKNEISLKGIERILLIRPDRIGDAIWTKYFVQKLKNNYPDISLDILASNYNQFIFRKIPEIDDVFSITENPPKYFTKNLLRPWKIFNDAFDLDLTTLSTLKNNNYDYVFDLTGRRRYLFLSKLISKNTIGGGTVFFDFMYKFPIFGHYEVQSEKHIVDKWFDRLGLEESSRFPQLFDTMSNLIESKGNDLNGKKFLFFIGGKYPNKFGQDVYTKLQNKLSEFGQVSILNDIESDQLGHKLDLVSEEFRVDGVEFSKFLEKFDYFVGVDGGVMNYASQFISCIGLYSSTNYKSCYPLDFENREHFVVSKGLDCAGCFQMGCKNMRCKNIL